MHKHVTVVPLAKRGFCDLNPCELGWEQCNPNHSFGPAIRDHYLIHYVVSGKGTFYRGDEVYPVRSGEVFIIAPGEVHSYAADAADPWVYIWVGFYGDAAACFNGLSRPVRRYAANTFSDVRRAASLSATREEFVTSKIFEMISVLFEDARHETPYEQQVINFIDTNYMKPITVESIADMMNLNRRYLSRMMKKRMGMTVSEYLIQTRLKHGAALLADGYSVHSAAAMVGYHDPFNFSKMFKKLYGVSPMAYQKKNH